MSDIIWGAAEAALWTVSGVIVFSIAGLAAVFVVAVLALDWGLGGVISEAIHQRTNERARRCREGDR